MGKKLYIKTETGTIFKSNRKPGEVRVPNYVWDLWVPLLGVETLGVYAVYCRLEREGFVKGMSMSALAKACHIGKAKLGKINKALERCGFIQVTAPTGQAKLMHWTNEIEVLDPPKEVTQELIDEFMEGREHEILAPWLLEEEEPEQEPPTVPDKTVGGQDKNPAKVPDQAPKIESPDLQPLDVEKESPSTPQDFGIGQTDPLAGVPAATDGHQRAVDKGNGGNGADPNQRVAEHLYWGFERGVVDLPPEKVWKKWYQGGKRLRERLPAAEVQNIARYIDDWFANKDSPEAFWQDNPLHDTALDVIARFIKNGGKRNAPNNRSGRVPGRVPEYSVADPAAFGQQPPDDVASGDP